MAETKTKRTKAKKKVASKTVCPEPMMTAETPDTGVAKTQPDIEANHAADEVAAVVSASATGAASVLVMDGSGIKLKKHQPVGKPWGFRGKDVYVAKIHGDTLVEFNPLAHTTNGNRPKYTPEDLFDAINWRQVKVIYRIESSMLSKLNTGLMIALVGILCFFIFLLFSSITGG